MKKMQNIFILFLLLVLNCPQIYADKAKLMFIVDGDTIKINGNRRVRFIGIDAPELYNIDKIRYFSKKWNVKESFIKKMGEESKKFLMNLYFNYSDVNSKIVLKYDKNYVYMNHKDKYGRILAYVYFPLKSKVDVDKKTMVVIRFESRKYIDVCATMLKSGYAVVYFYGRFDRKKEFLSYEEYARTGGIGLWKKENGLLKIWKKILKDRKIYMLNKKF